MFVPYKNNSLMQFKVIFEPKINRMVLVSESYPEYKDLIDFDYITSNLKLILKTEDPKGSNYSKIHIQLNESQSSQKPFKKMNPIKKYQTMVLNLSNFKSSINQNKHNDFEIVNITSKNDLVSKLNKIQNIAFENSWGYSPNTKDEIKLSSEDSTRPLVLKQNEIKIDNDGKKSKKYIPLSKRQDKPDSALWLIKQHSILKDSQIAKLVGITKNSATAIRNKSYWNFNNLNAKDPVAMGLFNQKDLLDALEKAERRIKREKKEKEKGQISK